MTTVTQSSLIGDVLELDPALAEIFLEMGMHCLGCPSARGESIAEACEVHGIDAEELVSRINTHLAAQ